MDFSQVLFVSEDIQCLSSKIRHHHKTGSPRDKPIQRVSSSRPRPPQNEICVYARVRCTDQNRHRSMLQRAYHDQHLGVSDGGGGSFWFSSGPSLTSHAMARPQLKCTSKWQCMIQTPACRHEELDRLLSRCIGPKFNARK